MKVKKITKKHIAAINRKVKAERKRREDRYEVLPCNFTLCQTDKDNMFGWEKVTVIGLLLDKKWSYQPRGLVFLVSGDHGVVEQLIEDDFFHMLETYQKIGGG